MELQDILRRAVGDGDLIQHPNVNKTDLKELLQGAADVFGGIPGAATPDLSAFTGAVGDIAGRDLGETDVGGILKGIEDVFGAIPGAAQGQFGGFDQAIRSLAEAPQGTDVGGISAGLRQLFGAIPGVATPNLGAADEAISRASRDVGTTDVGGVTGALSDVYGSLPGLAQGDFSTIDAAINAIRQGVPTSDVSGIQRGISGLFGALPMLSGVDTGDFRALAGAALGRPIPRTGGGLSDLFLQSLYLGGGAQSPLTARLAQQGLGGLERALEAPSFDQTKMFESAREAFEGDLEEQLARIKEETSGLGLGPGSSDRAERLARTAARETARFETGLQQMAQQAFESAQQRRLGALGQVPGLAQVTETPLERMTRLVPTLIGKEQIPFQESFALRGQELGFAPQLLAAAELPTRLRLQGAQQQAQLLPQALQAAQIPFQQESFLRGQNISALPALLQRGALPAELGLRGAAQQAQTAMQALQALQVPFQQEAALRGQDISAIPAMLQRGALPAQLGLQGAAQQASLLPMALDIARTPFTEQMAVRGQTLGQLPQLLARGMAPAQLALQGLNQQAGLLPLAADVSQIPFQQRFGRRGQDISLLPQLLRAGLGSSQLALQGAGQQANMIPMIQDILSQPFRESLAEIQGATVPLLQAENARRGIIGSLFPAAMRAFEQPFDLLERQFGLGERARQIVDADLLRQMGEFTRTENAGLNQIMAILSGVPLMNSQIGPSLLGQLGPLIAAGGKIAAAAI
jgi:hypothetical protein